MSHINIIGGGAGPGGGNIKQIDADVGHAVPNGAGVIDLNGGANINTSASGNQVVVNLNNNVLTASYETSDPANSLVMVSNELNAGGTNPDVNIDINTQGRGGIVFRGIPTGFTGTQWVTAQNTAQTVNNSPTPIYQIVVPEDNMVTIKAIINGMQADFSNAAGAEVLITVYRPTGGNVTIVGFPVIQNNSTSAATVTATVNIGLQTVNINVVGVAATVYNWVTTVQFMGLSSNA